MFGIHHFGVFVATGILLNLTPGQDTFYVLGRSISQGRNAGIASVLGIATGALVHTVMAALGFSALLAASSVAFMAVKLLGAAYLIYLGAKMLLSRSSATSLPSSFESKSFLSIYRQGLLTNVLNPKVALFFLALMPQFIAAESPHKALAFMTLGLSFTITGTLWCFCLAWFASQLSNRLRGNTKVGEILNRTAGTFFIFLGLRVAATK